MKFMKKRKSFLHVLMVSSIVLAGLFTLSACEKDDNDDDDNMYTISGNASGAQVVPSVSGSGSGTITGTFDRDTRTMVYTSTWTGLTDGPTSASFYSGTAGTAGTAVGVTWSLPRPTTGTGAISGSIVLSQEQTDELLNGGWYYSYTTTANPTGEIRGQISATR
jgi:hypothetical protein